MGSVKKTIFDFLYNKNLVEQDFRFRNSDSFWIGVTGLQVPMQISLENRKISIVKRMLLSNVVSVSIPINNSSRINFIIKESTLKSLFIDGKPYSVITIDDSMINLLDDAGIFNLKISISTDYISINYDNPNRETYIKLIDLKN